jgi:predicted transcriptional regulator
LKDAEKDILRKCILVLLRKGHVHYTDIEKKVVAIPSAFITSNTFKSQFYDYLLANGYVKKSGRGAYVITEKGNSLLCALSE